ncbi:hypothetical protein GAS19_18815 [Burkholderia glumae]|nr:hypothetical protein [Burkholderia glumae]QGA39678.1 hypothetical protein GAS19_18815 [Burkholderia glumae]
MADEARHHRACGKAPASTVTPHSASSGSARLRAFERVPGAHHDHEPGGQQRHLRELAVECGQRVVRGDRGRAVARLRERVAHRRAKLLRRPRQRMLDLADRGRDGRLRDAECARCGVRAAMMRGGHLGLPLHELQEGANACR